MMCSGGIEFEWPENTDVGLNENLSEREALELEIQGGGTPLDFSLRVFSLR